MQLEEAFFSGQPASIRKTVEFVSERIASACVKHICHDIVPEFKRKSMKELDTTLKLFSENSEDSKEVCRLNDKHSFSLTPNKTLETFKVKFYLLSSLSYSPWARV